MQKWNPAVEKTTTVPNLKVKGLLGPATCSAYWPLFKHMSENHGLTLLESEMEDIRQVVADMPKRRKYPRAKCPDCGQDRALHNGQIWNHIIGNKQCPGAGKHIKPNTEVSDGAGGKP